MNLIGFCGLAGSGKDTSADILVKRAGFVKVALADPMKRACAEWFNWSEETLWGPSENRNAPDDRYLRGMTLDQDTHRPLFLTPRHALQLLGTEFGRNCYSNVWVDYALRAAKTLIEQGVAYHPARGVTTERADKSVGGVVFSDIRFRNEIEAVRGAGGKIIRLLRGQGLQGSAALHPSEAEMLGMPDNLFDAVIDNREFTLQTLEEHVLQVVGTFLR